jgi:hypothetical protein
MSNFIAIYVAYGLSKSTEKQEVDGGRCLTSCNLSSLLQGGFFHLFRALDKCHVFSHISISLYVGRQIVALVGSLEFSVCSCPLHLSEHVFGYAKAKHGLTTMYYSCVSCER